MKLGELCEFKYGNGLRQDRRRGGDFPVYGSNGLIGWHDCSITEGPTIIIGRKGSLGEVHYSEKPCWPIDTTYYVDDFIRPTDMSWFYYLLQELELTKLDKSAAVPGLNRNDAYEKDIPFPPLPEQKRIAAILEKADRLRRLRRYARKLSDTFLQSVFLEMFRDPVSNSMEWEKDILKNLGRITTGSTPPTKESELFGGSIPFITPSDLEVNTLKPNRHLTEEGAKKSRVVRAGSSLVCCIGATIGKTDKARIESAFNQQINAIEWDDRVLDAYGLMLMRFYSRVVAERGRSTTLPILKKSAFEQIAVPITPLPMQEQYAHVVHQYENLQSQQLEATRQAEHLFLSLLHRAFRGEI